MSHPVMIFPEHWSTQKRILMAAAGLKEQLVEYTATGNPLTFNTDVAKPLKSLLIPWTPSQSGSGDPSPENPREIQGVSSLTAWHSGRNMFDYNEDNVTQEATSTGVTRAVYHTGLKNGKFTASGELKSGQIAVQYGVNIGKFKNNVATVVDSYISPNGVYTRTLTIAEDEELVLINTGDNVNETKQKLVKYDIQIELGETASEYTPYVGTTIHVTFPALGRNLFDATTYPLTEDMWISASTGEAFENTTSGYASTLDFIPCSSWQGKTITLNHRPGKSAPGIAYYAEDKTFISGTANSGIDAGLPMTFIVPVNAVYLRFTTSKATKDETMLEFGSQATTYEPYTSTVYGGSLDLATDVLTVTHGIKVFTGSEGFTWINSGTKEIYTASNVFKGIKKGTSYIFGYSNMVKTSTDYLQGSVLSKPNAQGEGVLFGNIFEYWGLETQSGEALDTLLSTMQANGTPLTVVYELATPLVYQLTPVEILSLVGDNVIWSDTNGSNTAVYLKRG